MNTATREQLEEMSMAFSETVAVAHEEIARAYATWQRVHTEEAEDEFEDEVDAFAQAKQLQMYVNGLLAGVGRRVGLLTVDALDSAKRQIRQSHPEHPREARVRRFQRTLITQGTEVPFTRASPAFPSELVRELAAATPAELTQLATRLAQKIPKAERITREAYERRAEPSALDEKVHTLAKFLLANSVVRRRLAGAPFDPDVLTQHALDTQTQQIYALLRQGGV